MNSAYSISGRRTNYIVNYYQECGCHLNYIVNNYYDSFNYLRGSHFNECNEFCVVLFPAPSGSPVYFQARVLDSRSVYLEWDPPLPDMQNGIIRKYSVTVVDVVGRETTINTTETNTTVSGLKPFSTYFCTVAAYTIEPGPSATVLNILTPQDGKYIA